MHRSKEVINDLFEKIFSEVKPTLLATRMVKKLNEQKRIEQVIMKNILKLK